MKRLLFNDLLEWKKSSLRKPLLLRGARQVGKTHLVRQLGRTFPHFVEINFEKTPELGKLFDLDLDPKRIIKELSIVLDVKILVNETLLFIDEIQEVPRAIIALRYFYEDLPKLHVVAAGSLVDFAIEKVGVPVGRIDFLYVYPISFIEFLCAINAKQLALEIMSLHPSTHHFSDVIHHKALRLLGEYMAIGGMPQAIDQWIKSEDILVCAKVLKSIKATYEADFSKYAKKSEIKYVDLLFTQLPHHIGEHFKYSNINRDYRKRELEPALFLLEKAGIYHRVVHSHGNGIPLGGEIDSQKFKLFMLDVGLTQAMHGLDLKEWFLDSSVSFVNKGTLTESYVGQEILAYADPIIQPNLYYWQREERGSHAEIDYLISKQQKIIPIEVKSGHGAGLQSMKIFFEKHPNTPFGVRFSIHPFSIHEKIHSYPLYSVAAVVGDKVRIQKFIQNDDDLVSS